MTSTMIGNPRANQNPDDGSSFRTLRRQRVAVLHERREQLIQHSPHASTGLINALVSDAFWGPDERWRTAITEADHNAGTSRPTPPAQRATSTTPATPQPAADTTEPARAPENRKPRSVLGRRRRDTPAVPSPAPAKAAPVADADDVFDVPPPGRRLSRVGRGRSWVTRVAITAGPLILIGGLAYSCGVSTGSDRVVVPPVITTDVAARYDLSTFPVDQAAAFGVAYLTLCLTHPDSKAESTVTNREASLASMTTAGVARGCGWDGKGPAQQPLSITYAGTHTPVDAQYPTGSAEQLQFTAVMQDGRSLGMSVPIWASGEPQNSQLRVVGEVAFLPALLPTAAPAPTPPRVTDSALSRYLTSAVLQPYFTAWATSDPVQLALLTTTDATALARQGMSGQISDPHVDNPTVVITRGDPTAYRDGDTATARTPVTWSTSNGQQRSTYEVDLRLVANRWLVVDIAGGPVDAGGGAAPAGTFASPTPTASSTPTSSS